MKNSEGLAYVELTSPNGSTTQVYTLGACVTSYKTDGVEYLKVRPDAKMDGSKVRKEKDFLIYCIYFTTSFALCSQLLHSSQPISGGLAFCWPQFGPDSGNEGLNLQQHGFARNEDWTVETVTGDKVVMSLSPTEYSKGESCNGKMTATFVNIRARSFLKAELAALLRFASLCFTSRHYPPPLTPPNSPPRNVGQGV